MSKSDDVKNLFRRFGGSASTYQEIVSHDQVSQAEQRWPILGQMKPSAHHEAPSAQRSVRVGVRQSQSDVSPETVLHAVMAAPETVHGVGSLAAHAAHKAPPETAVREKGGLASFFSRGKPSVAPAAPVPAAVAPVAPAAVGGIFGRMQAAAAAPPTRPSAPVPHHTPAASPFLKAAPAALHESKDHHERALTHEHGVAAVGKEGSLQQLFGRMATPVTPPPAEKSAVKTARKAIKW